MKINNNELHKLLIDKGVTHFYHANTVATSITFIRKGGLLSRGDVERLNLYQTSQASDDKDRTFDVWDDVFIDTVDLHGLFPRQNLYGSVLFKFNLNFLINSDLDIWVTKNNPMYWNSSLSIKEKYFCDTGELFKDWDFYQTQRKMFTIRKPNKAVLFESLESIILDNPAVVITKGAIDLKVEAVNALKEATKDLPNLRQKLSLRKCSNCFCQSNYLNQIPVSELCKLFLPVHHQII
jgi:hypothetical protein